MLRTICGAENYDAIVLTTTFWDQADRETGKTRETQLLSDPNKWGQLVHAPPKSSVRRHDQSYKTAVSIVDFIVKRGVKYELLIQRELAKPGATLYDTTAGHEAQMLWESDIERFRKELNGAREALGASRQASDATFADEIKSLKSSINERKTALDELLLPTEELKNRWMTRNNREVELLERQIVECHNTIDHLMQLSLSRRDSGATLPLQDDECASRAAERMLLDQERRKQKDLMAQKMAKLTARSMQAGVAGSLFGGLSAGIAMLPYMSMCTVM
jgi:hypothetical protein